jgi:hypothetical protein
MSSHIPPPPPCKQLCNRSCSNKHTHTHPVLKYRVPHGSQPRPGRVPDPLMVGIRSPIGLVVGSCTSHPGVLGSIPKREEPGKTGAPCVKVPGSSRVPGLGLVQGLGLDSLSHSSSHALPFFSPPSFVFVSERTSKRHHHHLHTLAFSPTFTTVWWSA